MGVGGERISSVKGGALLGLGLGRAAATDRTLTGAHALAPMPQEVRGTAGSGYLFIDEYQVGLACRVWRAFFRGGRTGVGNGALKWRAERGERMPLA